jgi:hypothetical protein
MRPMQTPVRMRHERASALGTRDEYVGRLTGLRQGAAPLWRHGHAWEGVVERLRRALAAPSTPRLWFPYLTRRVSNVIASAGCKAGGIGGDGRVSMG